MTALGELWRPGEPGVIPAGRGQAIPGPEGIVLKATAHETNGSVGVLEATSPAGFDAPPHIHHGNDELFYVLAGEFEFMLADRLVQAAPGAFVFVPRGTVHAPKVIGAATGKVLVTFVPGGQELAFEEFSRLAMASEGQPPPMDAIKEIAARYDSTFVDA